jgi:hypothetical protein
MPNLFVVPRLTIVRNDLDIVTTAPIVAAISEAPPRRRALFPAIQVLREGRVRQRLGAGQHGQTGDRPCDDHMPATARRHGGRYNGGRYNGGLHRPSPPDGDGHSACGLRSCSSYPPFPPLLSRALAKCVEQFSP